MKLKKLVILCLVTAMAFNMVACGSKGTQSEDVQAEAPIEVGGEVITEEEDTVIVLPEVDVDEEVMNQPASSEEGEHMDEMPAVDNTENEVETPEEKPEAKPEEKPEQKPAEDKKEETTEDKKEDNKKEEDKKEESKDKTVGTTLKKEFQNIAKDDSSALSIAESLVGNKVITFSGGAVPVEEGYLSGFSNYEVKGFSEGAMFAPWIGSIPFVGYVFTVDGDVDAFVDGLKANADLRWNICVEAEEMVAAKKGNKVFFVMCPKSLEE